MTPRATTRLLAIGAVAAAAWLGLGEIAWPARLFAVFLLVGLPALMVAQAGIVEAATLAELPRNGIYLSSAASLWLLAALAAAAAWASGLQDGLALGWLGVKPTLAWAAALTVGAFVIVEVARRLGLREAPLLAHLLPRTAGERIGFTGLSVTAGICEEFVFRGFLLGALLDVTPWPLATLLASGAFGVVHAYQRPAGALRAGALGALLAVPVLVHQSLWPAILAHAAIDLIAGLLLRDRFVR